MRNCKTWHEREAPIEFLLTSFTQRLDFRQLFTRTAPVEIDLGCGDGAYLTALARENPDRNFLGIERRPGRVRAVCRKAAELNLSNVRILRVETTYAVAHLISERTVSAFHLLFPDPWPKRRHRRRRIVTGEFVATIRRALVPEGLLHVATDHAEYFGEIARLTSPRFTVVNSTRSFPKSTFERRFAARGATVHRLLLRKTSPVR